jgi:hypothetical protein
LRGTIGAGVRNAGPAGFLAPSSRNGAGLESVPAASDRQAKRPVIEAQSNIPYW